MRNHILVIQRLDGVLTASLDEVGEVFVRYYQELFGTSRHTIPIDTKVACSGPCLDDNTYDLLISPMSNDAFKKALFSIAMKRLLVLMATLLYSSRSLEMLLGIIFVLLLKISLPLGNF